jgi:Ca-activated chloride channel family protein
MTVVERFMQRGAKRAGALPLIALSLFLSQFSFGPGARAAGFIMVDPAFSPVPVVRTLPVRPGPGVILPGPRPIPGHPTTPLLKGGVSMGLHLASQEIRVDVTDQVAKTYITQTFENDTDRNLAGTYLFPLPDDTTFSSFSLHIDGKPVEGKIMEAAEAREEYESIVRRMVDPGLLEYADYKTVRARIFPIPAHGTKKVELEYTQLLKAESGLVKYRFPLKGDDQASGAVDSTKFTAKISGRQGLKTLWSPSHVVQVNRPSEHQAKVSFEEKAMVADKDFLLYYSLSDKDLACNVMTHKVDGEDGYFLLTLSPPLKAQSTMGKDIVIAADVSGSMQGEKLEQLKKSLKYFVNSLSAQDCFGLVPFNTDAESFKSTLLPATPENKKLACDFIEDLEARGGTNIADALSSSFSLLKSGEERPSYLIMMTDGEPTVGETNVNNLVKLGANKKNVRIFDFGVGFDVNTRFLNKLAQDNHGAAQYIEPGENMELALSSFFEKIKAPVLADVNIAYEGLTVKDIYPRNVKDIFAGNQVLLLGRYKNGAKANINLTGKVNGVSKAMSFPVELAATETGHSYLPKLWAMRRIAYLTEVAQENGNNREVVDEIVALSKRHGIISAYTSFLSKDPNEGNNSVRELARPMGRSMPTNGPLALGGAGGGLAVGGALGRTQLSQGESKRNNLRKDDGLRFQFASNKSAFLGIALSRQAYSQPMSAAPVVVDERHYRAAKSAVGQEAVKEAKALDKLKNEAVLSSSDSLDSSSDFRKGNLGVKNVEGKTFYFNGVEYVDSQYKNQSLEKIEFASKQYFELCRKFPLLAKYFGVGKNVIVVFQGKAYKVTVP